jgi:tetratricopeptide (TPR) repeat protein
VQTASISDLAARIRAAADLSGRRRTLFTFLVGAGFSVSAGMPSTSHLVRVLKARLEAKDEQPRSWRELLDAALETRNDLGEPAALAYQRLLNEPKLFPFPPHRQRFITDVVRWAADRSIEMSRDSLLMAALLKAGSDSAPADGGLSQWIAHTLYTTNFDEILPQTFRYCGESVAVIDHPHAHGRAQGDAFYPRVVYLHGSHLYYDLRNTEQELSAADRDRTGGVDMTGLFQRFRDTLRSTGLIVLGYSGWRDRAMAAIRDALADRESLPFHLYWCAYPDVAALSDEARSVLEEHPGRAFVLEPGKTAAEVLSLLSEQLDFKYEELWSGWAERIEKIADHMSLFRETSKLPAVSAPASQPRAAVPHPAWQLEAARLIEQANRAQGDLDVPAMPALGAAIEHHLAAAGDEDRKTSEYRRLIIARAGLSELGPVDDAIPTWTAAVDQLRSIRDDASLASAIIGLTFALLRANRFQEAHATAEEALEYALRSGSAPITVRAMIAGARVALARNHDEEAHALTENARRRAQGAHLESELATVQGLMMDLGLRDGHYDRARIAAAQQLSHRVLHGPRGAHAWALLDAGRVEQTAGKLSRAADHFARAAQLFRRTQFSRGLAVAAARLGNVLVRQGNLDGWRWMEEALALVRTEPHRDRAVPYAMALPLLLRRGELARAESMLDELDRAPLPDGSRARVLRHRASIASRRDDEEQSNRLYAAAEEIFLRVGDVIERASTLSHWGVSALTFGRLAVAEERLRRALELMEAVEDDPAKYDLTARLAVVLAERDDVDGAEQELQALSTLDPGEDVAILGSGERMRASEAIAARRLHDAQQHLARAELFFSNGDVYFSRGRVAIERARVAQLSGDFARAEMLLREVVTDAAHRGEALLARLANEKLSTVVAERRR